MEIKSTDSNHTDECIPELPLILGSTECGRRDEGPVCVHEQLVCKQEASERKGEKPIRKDVEPLTEQEQVDHEPQQIASSDCTPIHAHLSREPTTSQSSDSTYITGDGITDFM